MDTSMAYARWELENEIQTIGDGDTVFRYDIKEESALLEKKPWENNPNYFKQMSALALLKIAMHAKSGGTLEIMGLMQGKVIENTFVIIDAFPLPVEGTETRVNAMESANVFMCEFISMNEKLGQKEHVIGWYHSHPGYGCWLSGIDVATQMINQQGQDPFLAIVIDPIRTMSAGKVEIGAFRTYPEGYNVADDTPSEYQTIPLNKIEDFGVHAKQYYSLDISYFKSDLDRQILDMLWKKHWVNTLASSPLLSNKEFLIGQISDVAEKIEKADLQIQHRMQRIGVIGDKSKQEASLPKICKDTAKLATEQIKGLSLQLSKHMLFNCRQQYLDEMDID